MQLRSIILAPCLNEHIYRLLVIVSDRSLEATKTAARENQKERQEEAINFHRANLFFPSYLKGKISNLHYVYFYEYVAIYRKTKNDVEQHLEIEALLRLVKKITRLKRRY